MSNSHNGWTLSRHALARAAERLVNHVEIWAVLDAPEVTYSQSTHGPGRTVLQAGRLGVIVHADSRVVITIVFRDPQAWESLTGRAA